MALVYGPAVVGYGVGYQPLPVFYPSETVLAGVPRDQLQAWLATAQNNYMRLSSGGEQMIQSVGYDGKNVTYVVTDLPKIEAFIQLLQRQLGLTQGRRAIRPIFR